MLALEGEGNVAPQNMENLLAPQCSLTSWKIFIFGYSCENLVYREIELSYSWNFTCLKYHRKPSCVGKQYCVSG